MPSSDNLSSATNLNENAENANEKNGNVMVQETMQETSFE